MMIINEHAKKPPSITIVVIVALMMLPVPAFAVVENLTEFEWAMPDRLLVDTSIPGHDSGDPIPRYDPDALMLPPDGWTVNFDACNVSTSTIVTHQWFVDGDSVATTANCQFSYQFPKEGSYLISLMVTDDVGDTAMLEETITVQDWLIVAMGDSYGSGEGNPQIPVSAQAQIDFTVLNDLAANIRADLDAALAQLPGLEDAQAAAQQLVTNTQATLEQAQDDLADVQADLNSLTIILVNVDNEPAVVAAQAVVTEREQNLAQRQAEYNAALAAWNNCTGIIDCAADLAALGIAETNLLVAQSSLATANAALWTARTAAVVIYSTIATIQDFDALTLAIDAAELAVNAARNTYNIALNAYNSAQAALQDAIDAVTSLQAIIGDLQNAWNDAAYNAATDYLDHLPVWNNSPPSWGPPEPTFKEILLFGESPGEALRCHRSMYSGQARAALALELADPHTSVTFVHLSCTGATINRGLKGGYDGADPASILDPLVGRVLGNPDNPMNHDCVTEDEPPKPRPCDMPSQLDQALEKTLGREIDAMVISIGGNDIKFARIITECVLGQPCDRDIQPPPDIIFDEGLVSAVTANCSPVDYFNNLSGLVFPFDSFLFSQLCFQAFNVADNTVSAGDALHTFNAYMYGLPGVDDNGNPVTPSSLQQKMRDLRNDIATKLENFDQSRVYITEYPDPTGDDNGNTCEWFPDQGGANQSLPGVTGGEASWAQVTVATALREETRTAAQEHTWNFVSEMGEGSDTIGTASRNHGYCADDHWTVRIPESLITQQDVNGSMHPNRDGHGLYKTAVFNALMADLYPTGIDKPPRQPVEPPVSNNPAPVKRGGGGGGALHWMLLFIFSSVFIARRSARWQREEQSASL